MKTTKALRALSAAVTTSTLLMVGACGLKGDLYIPSKEASPASTTTDSTDEPETESELQEERTAD